MPTLRNRAVFAVEVTLLAAAVALLALQLAAPALFERVLARLVPRELAAAPAAPTAVPVRPAAGGDAGSPSPLVSVPPREMYDVFAAQYRMRPDRRVLMAFETLSRRYGQWRGDAAAPRFAAGAVRADAEKVVVPLVRDGVVAREAVLPVPASFAQVRGALDEWVAAMGGAGAAAPRAPGRSASVSRQVDEAVRLIDMVDPRYVVAGLTVLERAWQRDGARDARILRAAARGYAMLLLTLCPDAMELADPFAAEGLAFLVLARRADPALPLAREEALLAMTMGYRAHAARLLEGIPRESRTPAETVLDAYMRQDLLVLRRAGESDPGVLGPYLLARHYREAGLGQEAKAAARTLLQMWPALYPSAVEIIHSGDLGEEKILTILYPHEIAAQVRVLVDPGTLKDLPSWTDLARKIVDGRVMPLSEFEGLLGAWKPYGDDNTVRFLVDAGRARGVFRCLYADAVKARFELLFDRWTVRDEARAYAESLAATDNTHPLVLLMSAKVAADRGDREAADRLFERVISRDGTGGDLVYEAYRGLSDTVAKARLLPAAAARLDGRPANVLLSGWLLGHAYNYDLAARFYAAGLAEDPYAYWACAALAYVRGTDAPLRDALRRAPNSYNLLREAGEYFAKQGDAASKEAAERAYAAAQALAPSVRSLAAGRARALRDLGRPRDAIKVMDAWIARYGDDGLGTIIMNARRAQTYLEMGRPADALRILGNDAESMQGTALAAAAEIHEALGDPAAAWEYHRKGVERYPTSGATLAGAAAFLWRQGGYDEAARVIAGGASSQDPSEWWYADEFMSVFRDAPGDNVTRAAAALRARGIPLPDIECLAHRFWQAGRNEVAFALAAGLRDPGSNREAEYFATAYEILRDWKGKAAASAYLRTTVPPHRKIPLLMVLYQRGLNDAILEEAGDPALYGPVHEEFIWLQKLLAWLALDRKPEGLAAAFDAHYASPGPNKYHLVGRYLLGKVSRDELLNAVRAPKDRCEFAYYIGYSERLRENFGEATQWYRLCLEILLMRNGEAHWAYSELYWWAHMGTDNRHRRLADDLAERRKAQRRDVKGRSFM